MRQLLCPKGWRGAARQIAPARAWTARHERSKLSDQRRGLARFFRSAHGLWREVLTALACLLVGVLVMPCLIFAVGRNALGPYAHGSVLSLWHDFLRGLASGSQAFWFIALGPYLLLMLLRGGRRLLT
jgi:hypothetical protein